MLSVRNVSYVYGKIQAITDISFSMSRGEILALVGANGAGKSTLMKCISGLLKPKSGEMIFEDKTLESAPYKVVNRGIVLVPEGRWIFPGLTVEENLLLGGYTSKKPKEGIKRSYDLFPRLMERKMQRAGTLSGGEQQMLAIARGLMANPKLLLLDEPSLGLAPKIVNDIFRTIKEINAEGVSVLIVEQNAKKALKVAHNACILETGKVIAYGKADDISESPEIVKVYLGSKK